MLGDISPMGWCRLFSREMRGLVADASSFNGGGGGPALALDFLTPGTLDPRLTFSRASGGTYFDSAGVMRNAATHLLLWSQDVTQAAWTKIGSPVVSATVAAPDGTMTAQTIALGISTGPAFYQTCALANGVRGEPSFWVNVTSAPGATVLVVTNPANLANGQWNVNPTALIGAGWQRITRSHSAVTIVTEFTGVSNLGGIFVNANTGTVNASWWGWQFQTGTTSTPYIATTTTPMGAPRWDYDPATLALRGLLIEEARTNGVPNGNAAGAVVSGALPTGWAESNNTGIAPTVAGVGTESGIPYVDIRFAGTTSSGTANNIFIANATVAAGNSQAWTASVYLRLTAGTIPANSVSVLAASNIGPHYPPTVTPTGAPLVTQRYLNAFTTAASGVTSLSLIIGISMPATTAVNFTLRIGAAQLEAGAFATSYIPTTSAAVTRAADVATLPTTGGWFNASAGTAGVEFQSVNPGSAGGQGGIMRLDDGGTSNFMTVFATSGAGAITFYGLIGGVAQINDTLGATVSGTPQRIAYNYGGGLWRYAMGGAVASGSGSATPFSATRVIFGGSSVDTTAWKLNGHLRAFRYWSRALSDAEMQQITANP